METLLILSGGGFIAYVIISALRVRKFNKTHRYQRQIQPLKNTREVFEYNGSTSILNEITDPSCSYLSYNIYHKED